MPGYFHSVRLTAHHCKGCVNCIKRCPTEAIRIRGGKAQITEARCIDCGECIRRCPNHAKTAYTDCLDDLARYKYNVALPAPSLYAQFPPHTPVNCITSALNKLGFDEVFEVAQGAEIVTLAIRDYLKRSDIKRPVISSACPAVVRLVQVKFPELIEHLLPIDAPVEVAARIVRTERSRELGIDPDEIGLWFITPCPAKMTAVRQPLGSEKSNITGAIAISKIYGELLKALPSSAEQCSGRRASWVGVGWAVAGGETTAAQIDHSLIVHEIHSVAEVLEQVALGKLKHIDYIEALACASGCIGGPLTVESRFVAEQWMKKRLKDMRSEDTAKGIVARQGYDEVAELGVNERRAIEPRPIMRLDDDIFKAMYKVEVMDKTLGKLPGLDCGSCGSPSCKALAEDIAQGTASETDCIFRLREKVRDLAQEMVDIAQKLPPSLGKDNSKTGREDDK
ncbi:MAG: 4Fe-4S binding protein [Negativicutes bacterium]|nr:4Fe-4S binding protein [Negativicutes bacterium]